MYDYEEATSKNKFDLNKHLRNGYLVSLVVSFLIGVGAGMLRFAAEDPHPFAVAIGVFVLFSAAMIACVSVAKWISTLD